MKIHTLSHLLSGAGLLLCVFFIRESVSRIETAKSQKKELAQTYFGPTEGSQEDKGLVRIELHVKDGPKSGSPQVESVTFDGQSIPLKPRGVFGKRGVASFQLPPGTYLLQWEVSRNKWVWPRTTSHKKEVHIDGKELWIQIIIEGDNVSIL